MLHSLLSYSNIGLFSVCISSMCSLILRCYFFLNNPFLLLIKWNNIFHNKTSQTTGISEISGVWIKRNIYRRILWSALFVTVNFIFQKQLRFCSSHECNGNHEYSQHAAFFQPLQLSDQGKQYVNKCFILCSFRTNSDSAIHTSTMGPAVNSELDNMPSPTTPPPHRRSRSILLTDWINRSRDVTNII